MFSHFQILRKKWLIIVQEYNKYERREKQKQKTILEYKETQKL